MTTETQFHNPQNLESPGEGYAFLKLGDKIVRGDEWWSSHYSRWEATCTNESTNEIVTRFHSTYRRKLTEPKEVESNITMKYKRKHPFEIEAITFDELVEIGIKSGASVINGRPWSFEYNGKPVSHENDACYLVNTSKGIKKFQRGEVLVTEETGEYHPLPMDIFNALYEVEKPEVPEAWMVRSNKQIEPSFTTNVNLKERWEKNGWEVISLYSNMPLPVKPPEPTKREEACPACGGIGAGGGTTLCEECHGSGTITPRPEQSVIPMPEGTLPTHITIEKRKVPLSAKDCPPGSVFRHNAFTPDGWSAPSDVRDNYVCLSARSPSYKELMDENWLILRPGSTQFEPCFKMEDTDSEWVFRPSVDVGGNAMPEYWENEITGEIHYGDYPPKPEEKK